MLSPHPPQMKIKKWSNLCYDKNVVNPNAEQKEWDDGVGRGVEPTKQGAQPVRQDHPHEHAHDAHDG